LSQGEGGIFRIMKRRFAILLVSALLASGFATPCSCLDCHCGDHPVAEEARTIASCCDSEPCCPMSEASCDSHNKSSSAPKETPCPCGGQDPREAPSTTPHTSAEILVRLQALTAPLPAVLDLSLQTWIDVWVSNPSERPN